MLGLEASLMCTESPQACIAKTGPEPARKKRLEFLTKAEDDYIPATSFLKNVQACVNVEMRARVVEQMNEVIQDSNNGDVFQTACNLLDRFLSKRVVSSEHELVSCAGACVMIAIKVRNGPSDQHHNLTSCIPCSMDLLVVKEREICQCLKWNVYCVTPSDFIDELLPFLGLPHQYMNKIIQHANNLSSFAVSEYCLVGSPPSLIASGAICCAVDSLLPRYTANYHKTLTNLTAIEQETLLQCQRNINACFEQRLNQLHQSHGVQHKDDEPTDARTPTEINQLFFENFHKPQMTDPFVHRSREHL